MVLIGYRVTALGHPAAGGFRGAPVAFAGEGRIAFSSNRALRLVEAGMGPRKVVAGQVTSLFADPGAPAELYASGPELGVIRSMDGGRSWEGVMGHGLPSGRVRALAYDPGGARRLIAAVEGQGVFQSDNGGDEWMPLGNELPPDLRALAVSPLDPRVFLAGTPHGLYVSTNQGMRFDPVDAAAPRWAALPLREPVYALAVAGDRSAMLAATGEAVYRSIDGGRAWTRLADPGLPDVFSVAFAPRRSTTVLAASRSGQLALSLDGGNTWGPVR